MKRKITALCVVVAMLAVAIIGGTFAYFTDTDSAVNVMTMGNVKIEQHEKQREGSSLVDFQQNKPMLPVPYDVNAYVYLDGNKIEGANGNLDAYKFLAYTDSEDATTSMPNVIDKIVTVENTGKSNAYVRTIFAFEVAESYGEVKGTENLIGFMRNDKDSRSGTEGNGNTDWTWQWFEEVVEIRGVKYVIASATHEAVLAPKATTIPSLLQVYMKYNATQDYAEKLGDEYSILVLSQAVQADGFNNASEALNAGFGAVTVEDAAKWFDELGYPVVPVGYQVSNNGEFAAAVAAGETEIWLNPGTYNAPAAAKGETLTISGTKDAVLEVVPQGQSEAYGQLDYNFDGSKVTFNGITIKTNSQLYAGYARLSGTYNNCVIQNTYNLGIGNSAFYNCEFNITNEYLRVGGASTAIFDNCTFNTDGRAILVFQDGTSVAQTVTVKDCTFNATAAAQTWNGIHVAAVSIDGTNGTYTVNLEGTNTVDSDFNGLWQIKAGEANVTVNE